jgi:hypothetical protein
MDEIEYVGNRGVLPEGYTIMVSNGFKLPPKPRFKIWKEYGHWHIKIKIPGYPKWLDKLLKPLCRHGWHRWLPTIGFRQYSYGPETVTTWTAERKENFICARCKKNKTVKVK